MTGSAIGLAMIYKWWQRHIAHRWFGHCLHIIGRWQAAFLLLYIDCTAQVNAFGPFVGGFDSGHLQSFGQGEKQFASMNASEPSLNDIAACLY